MIQHPNQSLVLSSIVDLHPEASDLSWEGAWHSLWNWQGVPPGTWNERMLAWINAVLGASLSNLTDAMNLYARVGGYQDWSALASVYLDVRDTMHWDADALMYGDDDLIWSAT